MILGSVIVDAVPYWVSLSGRKVDDCPTLPSRRQGLNPASHSWLQRPSGANREEAR